MVTDEPSQGHVCNSRADIPSYGLLPGQAARPPVARFTLGLHMAIRTKRADIASPVHYILLSMAVVSYDGEQGSSEPSQGGLGVFPREQGSNQRNTSSHLSCHATLPPDRELVAAILSP
jgi:hypothetical protein